MILFSELAKPFTKCGQMYGKLNCDWMSTYMYIIKGWIRIS